jgi:hypothetical protein
MIFVRASNNKLIDRAIRYYIDMILKNKKIKLPYETIVHIIFERLEKTQADHAIVLGTFAEIGKN